jgi:hypothetical protein
MKRRERRSPELRRLDKLGPEGRHAEVQRLIAEADQPAPVDVEAAVRRVIAEQEAERAERRRQAHYDAGRSPSRTPCSHCGIESIEVASGQPWHIDPAGGHYCALCDRRFYGAPGFMDADRRLSLIVEKLGVGVPIRVLDNPQLVAGIPVWHREFPGAPPATTYPERFSHIDVEQLRARWEAIAYLRADVSARFEKGDPCGRCGCDSAWGKITIPTRGWAPAMENGEYVTGWDGQPVYRETFDSYELTVCAGCSYPHSPGEVPADMDIDEFAAVFVLRDPRRIAPGVAEVLGVRWWSDAPRRRANTRPFDHIDMPTVRARAAELWPDEAAWSAWRQEHAPVSDAPVSAG